MQKYCTELTERLLKSLDKEYNVVDMGAVVDIISALEKTTVTKEVLEITRLGKYINELRRKTNNDTLAKRAKDLVRRWRDMVLPSAHSTPQPMPADTAPPALNGAKPHSPALRNFKPHSPALRGLKPQSPLLKDATSLKVLSPALSVNSDHTRSPNWSSNKQSITSTSNCRISSNTSPALCSSSQNHIIEAVPRTHSSNKRLRKEENKEQSQSSLEIEPIAENEESLVKKQRLNGENISGNINSQVPSPMLKERTSSNRFIGIAVKASSDDSGPKKRGRKKGSRSTKHQSFLEDHVKEKLASISRNPKLKTTQELLADLQARGTNCNAVGSNPLPSQSTTEPPSMEDVLRGSSSEQMFKYLRCSQKNSNHHRSSTSEASVSKVQTRSKSTENSQEISVKSCQESHEDISDVGLSICRLSPQRDLTVEEILAKLPPLDPNSIDWSEFDTPEYTEEHNGTGCSPSPRKVTAEDVERLHSQCVEGLNGNFQPRIWSVAHSDGDEHSNRNEDNTVSSGLSNMSGANRVYRQTDGEEFREWHQVLSRSSHEGQPLHILPYVIID